MDPDRYDDTEFGRLSGFWALMATSPTSPSINAEVLVGFQLAPPQEPSASMGHRQARQ